MLSSLVVAVLFPLRNCKDLRYLRGEQLVRSCLKMLRGTLEGGKNANTRKREADLKLPGNTNVSIPKKREKKDIHK